MAYFYRGTLSLKKGDADAAILDYDKSIELAPKVAVFYTSRGQAREKKGDAAGAQEDYLKAKSLQP